MYKGVYSIICIYKSVYDKKKKKRTKSKKEKLIINKIVVYLIDMQVAREEYFTPISQIRCFICGEKLLYDPRTKNINHNKIENAFSDWIWQDLEKRLQFRNDTFLTTDENNNPCHETCYCEKNNLNVLIR